MCCGFFQMRIKFHGNRDEKTVAQQTQNNPGLILCYTPLIRKIFANNYFRGIFFLFKKVNTLPIVYNLNQSNQSCFYDIYNVPCLPVCMMCQKGEKMMSVYILARAKLEKLNGQASK